MFGHSIGATCAIGAASMGAPFRRMVLYEPPGPRAVPAEWIGRLAELIAGGQAGRAAPVAVPVLLLLGSESPAWAGAIPRELAEALPEAELAMLPGSGHEAINTATGKSKPNWCGS